MLRLRWSVVAVTTATKANNVRAVREKTGMSQQKFCAAFGISIGTLRHWEQGLRTPIGPARVLLKVVQHC